VEIIDSYSSIKVDREISEQDEKEISESI